MLGYIGYVRVDKLELDRCSIGGGGVYGYRKYLRRDGCSDGAQIFVIIFATGTRSDKDESYTLSSKEQVNGKGRDTMREEQRKVKGDGWQAQLSGEPLGMQDREI